MDRTTIEKLAYGTMVLQEKYNELQEEVEILREQNETFLKRARAEDVLIEAKDTPCKYRTVTMEDFLSKRAELESQSFESLEKIASAIKYIEDSEGLTLSDLKDGNDRGDFTSWLNTLA